MSISGGNPLGFIKSDNHPKSFRSAWLGLTSHPVDENAILQIHQLVVSDFLNFPNF